MSETKREEHARLQRRTDELKEEHAALDLSRKPFNKAEHEAHNADLVKHRADLVRHRTRPAD